MKNRSGIHFATNTNRKCALFVALSILCTNFSSCGAVEIEPKKEITKRSDVSISNSLSDNSSVEVLDSGAADEFSNDSVNDNSVDSSKTTTTKKKKKVKQTESSESADEDNTAVTTIIPNSENNNAGNDSQAVTTAIPDQPDIENLQSSLPITFEPETTTVQNPNPYGLSADEYLYQEILDKYVQTLNSGGNSMSFYTSSYDLYWNPKGEKLEKNYYTAIYSNPEQYEESNISK